MGLEEYKGVFVFAQQVDNVLDGVAFELLGKGKDLAKDLNTEVTAVLIGSGVKGLADQLAEYGADKVIVVDDPELKDYRTEPYTHALASVINTYKPEIMLVGATAIGRDLGPRVSARVQTGLTADCTVLEIGDFPLNPVPGPSADGYRTSRRYAENRAKQRRKSKCGRVQSWIYSKQQICGNLKHCKGSKKYRKYHGS